MALNCQRCGSRPATIHVTEVQAAGAHQEAHLCSACCQEAGWNPEVAPPAINDLLAAETAATPGEAESADDPACGACGLKLSEYQQVNLFGCQHDYADLGNAVGELIRRWHGTDRHVGRRPGQEPPAAIDAERADLEVRLAAAVSGERYEEAAQLRDALRKL